MSAQQYRKKPVVIEAFQLIDDLRNHIAVSTWIRDNGGVSHIPAFDDGLIIETLEGNMLALTGDYIIKGVNGEFYPCKPDIFVKTYDAVQESAK